MIINHRTCKKPLPCEKILVEIGFGRGDFLVRLAQDNTDSTIIGFETSGISIEKAENRLRRLGITNVLLIQMDAFWGFHFLLKEKSVREVFINFPDPWFKKRHFKRRLTSKEKLCMFASRLVKGGRIKIRSDYEPFVEYSVRSAKEIGTFYITKRRLLPYEPLTKYEGKALSFGREIHEIILELKEHPAFKGPPLKEVKDMLQLKKKGRFRSNEAQNQTIRVRENIILKTFRVIESKDTKLIECLISEYGFTQRFFIQIKEEEGISCIDVSPFSEVIRTEGIKMAVEKFSELWIKP